MGILKTAVSIGVLVGAFYAGTYYNETRHQEKQIRVDIVDNKPHLNYFGKTFPIAAGPRVGTLDQRVNGFVMDYQEHPQQVQSILQGYTRGSK